MFSEGNQVAVFGGNTVLYTGTVRDVSNGWITLDAYDHIRFRALSGYEHPDQSGRYIRPIAETGHTKEVLDAVVSLRGHGVVLAPKAYGMAERLLGTVLANV